MPDTSTERQGKPRKEKERVSGNILTFIPGTMEQLADYIRGRGWSVPPKIRLRDGIMGGSLEVHITISHSQFHLLFSKTGCRYVLEPYGSLKFRDRVAAERYAHRWVEGFIRGYVRNIG